MKTKIKYEEIKKQELRRKKINNQKYKLKWKEKERSEVHYCV